MHFNFLNVVYIERVLKTFSIDVLIVFHLIIPTSAHFVQR